MHLANKHFRQKLFSRDSSLKLIDKNEKCQSVFCFISTLNAHFEWQSVVGQYTSAVVVGILCDRIKNYIFKFLTTWEWMRNAQYATDIVTVVHYVSAVVCTKLLTVKNDMHH